jgi:hypothetical protein
MTMDADHAMQSLSINNKSVDKGYLNISWLKGREEEEVEQEKE